MDRSNAIVRMRRGHAAAAARRRELMRKEGPRPKQAVAEAIAATEALAAQGLWPGDRDPVRARGVELVRQRWVRIERRAKKSRQQQR
jgi:hypothetical protein